MEKPEPSDTELLADWQGRHRDPAFHALVARYAGLVHTAAKRTCGDDSMAADASQLTFILLALKAKSLTSRSSLAGWLHLTAVMQAKNLLRQNRRENRKRQLLQAAMETAPPRASRDVWQEMQPVLDEALAVLSDKDREALLLRFYRALSVREIAATLGIATDAAQKRIDRATERLRGKLARRGVQAGGSLSAAMLAGFAADAQAAVLPVSIIATKAIAAGSGVLSISFLTTAAMKTTSFVIAVVSAGVWITGQFQSIARLEQQNVLLASRLAAAPPKTSAAGSASVSKKFALDRLPIDWAAVLAELRSDGDRGGWGTLKNSARMELALRSMTREQLAAGLKDIAQAKLPQEDRKMLEGRLITLLAAEDPEYAVKEFLPRVHDENWQSTLARALGQWAKKNPEEAAAWFDEQVAAGKFESRTISKNYGPFMLFKGLLVSGLLSVDAAAAGRQLAALPEAERMGGVVVFAETYRKEDLGLKEADHAAYANLLRQQLPAADHLEAITFPVTPSGDGSGDGATIDYSVMDGYFSRIDATSEEREACILYMARLLRFPRKAGASRSSIGDLDTFREWVERVAPEVVDQATAQALSAVSNQYESNYSEWAAYALRCHEAGGSDAVLIPMLEAENVSENIGLARTLAARLSDEKRRAGFLEKLDQMRSKP